MPLTAEERDRLHKLIGMLGSAHDGERANAAGFIARMASEHRMTMTELMLAYGNTPVLPQASQPAWQPHSKMLTALAQAVECRLLNDWERNFAQDVSQRYDDDTDLSDRQAAIVVRILDKVKRWSQS